MDLNPYVFCDLFLLERGVQVTTYDFGFMDDNSITNQFDGSLFKQYVGTKDAVRGML
jgi:hypothetical protein